MLNGYGQKLIAVAWS